MKKTAFSVVALLMTVPTFAQAIFGNGLDTMRSEAEYWIKGLLIILFAAGTGHTIMSKFIGENPEYLKGSIRIGAYLLAAGALWAGYDYMQTIR